MTSIRNSHIRLLSMVGSVLVGFSCLACDDKTYDLDQRSSNEPGHGGIVHFAMDHDRLYWIEEYQSEAGDRPWGHILVGCEKHDCSATRKEYADQPADSGLFLPCFTVGNQTAYFNNYPDHTTPSYVTWREIIWEFAPGQAEPEPVQLYQFPAGSAFCNAIAVDDSELYRIDEVGVIVAISLSSDPFPRVVATGPGLASPTQLLAHGDFLYWASYDGGVRRTRKDGTLPAETLSATVAARSLAVDDNYLYWLDAQAKALLRCNPAACAETIMSLTSINAVPDSPDNWEIVRDSLQVQAGILYWLEGELGGWGTLRRCSIDGCPDGPELVASENMYFYALDETDVYGVVRSAAPTADGSAQREIRVFPK